MEANPSYAPVPTERDALRIQAAALVAQQAALTEQETEVRQNQLALEQHRSQLAAHLDEKRRRLSEIQEQIRKDRCLLQEERSALERQVADSTRTLALTENEVAENRRQMQIDRRRLKTFRRRLKQRWHRQWSAERAAWQHRQAELTRREQQLQQEDERLLKEKTEWDQARLRWTGEIELSRRELHAARESLNRDWEQFKKSQHGCQQREADLAEREEKLAAGKCRWEQSFSDLTKEAQGLEKRIQNQRLKLAELEQTVADHEKKANDSEKPAPIAPASPAGPLRPHSLTIFDQSSEEIQERMTNLLDWETALHQYWAALDKLAGDLADQRLHLAEQCERFVLTQGCWQGEHQAATERLEAMESQLESREQEMAKTSDSIRQRQEEATQARVYLEAFQARLTARTAAWEAERQRWIAHLANRELLIERLLTIIGELHSQWRERHSQEFEQFRDQRKDLEETHRDLVAHRDLWLERCEELEREKSTLLRRLLSLDKNGSIPQEKSQRPVGQKLFLKWGRRFAALSATWERALAQERQSLQLEGAKLEERFAQMQTQRQEIAKRESDLASREIGHEHGRALAEAAYARLRQELQSLKDQRDAYEGQLAELKGEVERLAGLLLKEEADTLPIAKAA